MGEKAKAKTQTKYSYVPMKICLSIYAQCDLLLYRNVGCCAQGRQRPHHALPAVGVAREMAAPESEKKAIPADFFYDLSTFKEKLAPDELSPTMHQLSGSLGVCRQIEPAAAE